MILKVTISLTNGKWFDDACIHAGAVGIYEAAKRFDTGKGFTFLTYAVPWIKKYVMQEVCNDVLPAGGIAFGRDFKVALFRFIGYRMSGKSNAEIAARLKIPLREVEKLATAASIGSRPVSLSSFDSAENEDHDVMDMAGVPSTPSAEDSYFEEKRGRHWFDGVDTEKEARQRALNDICVVIETLPEAAGDIICDLLGICGHERKDEKEIMRAHHWDRDTYVCRRRDAYYKLKRALERAGM